MRGSLTVGAVLLVTMFAIGCSQTSPTVPSSVAQAVIGPTSSGFVTPRSPTPPPIEPLLARLNLVANHLTSANHQLKRSDEHTPPPHSHHNPVCLHHPLNNNLKANGVI